MGSPNFKTSGVELNLASFPFSSDADNIDSQEYNDDYESHLFTLAEIKKDVQEHIDNIRPLDFFKIEIESGYHEGFQVMLIADVDIDDLLSDLAEYGEVYGKSGHRADDMQAFEFARSGSHNITPWLLKDARNREFKYAFNYLLAVGRECGLGEIFGGGYCSHVGDIETKPLPSSVPFSLSYDA